MDGGHRRMPQPPWTPGLGDMRRSGDLIILGLRNVIRHPQPCGSSRARSDAPGNGVCMRLGGRTHGWDPLHTDV